MSKEERFKIKDSANGYASLYDKIKRRFYDQSTVDEINKTFQQLAELKTENTDLKEELNQWKFDGNIAILELQQQLKEKDEEIKRLNNLYPLNEEKVKQIAVQEQKKFMDEIIKLNTKQVCENIKKEFKIHQENWDKVCDWAERGLLPETTYNDVIDQIEKGEVNGQV